MSTESIEFFNIEWSNKYDGFNAIAAKDLKPGDVIIHEHQFAQQILSQFQGQMCEICYKEVKEGFAMKWCARCKQAFYCSKQCQIKHWNLIHKFECKVFEKAEPGLLMQTIRISFRVYLRTMNMIMNENKQKDQNSMEAKQFKVSKNILDRGKPTETQIENMNSSPLPRKHIHTSNDFLSLLSHLDKASHQNKIGLQFVSSRLLQLLGINPSSPARYYQNANAVVEASEIIAKVINNFENCTCKETQDHYIAIFPRLALINHSCYPNVKHTYCTDGSALAIATKEIKKGESLFVSYVGLKYPFSIRQKKLLHWHFSCDCERCIKNIEGQLILKEMEENKKKVGQDGQTISIYNDYKFPSDMYGDALYSYIVSIFNPLEQLVQGSISKRKGQGFKATRIGSRFLNL
ncbi:MAG: hypothetical protein EZS28_000279 [Streblomastix strix]|uniref:SET domain-containing protein n=1 Tax=Streblomastix strix TaxID=222440 RepID=A0A5J4XBK9_9EUKA|nr:MAG: hypothetical protein EZS28_000279 [Streblomastix strix]